MASHINRLKSIAANLPDNFVKILADMSDAFRGVAAKTNDEENDAPRPRGRPANSSRSATRTATTKPASRGPGRPRRSDEEDEQLTRPRRASRDERNNKRERGNRSERATTTTRSGRNAAPAPRKAAAAAPRAATNSELDFSDMSKSDLSAVANKWGIRENRKLLRDSAKLQKVLMGIQKVANSPKHTLASVEKMAQRAKVDLVFGKGRPPNTDEGLKRRVLAKMADEGAYNG